MSEQKQKYSKKDEIEHILTRPDSYFGDIEFQTETVYLLSAPPPEVSEVKTETQIVAPATDDNDSIIHFEPKQVRFCSGILSGFNEVAQNAADNKERNSGMTQIKVTVDQETGTISVWNNGKSIPNVIHEEYNQWHCEFLFGELRSSSNYDDSVKRTTGGRNGFGATLTNIFSSVFTVECQDKENARFFKQTFSKNMREKTEPLIKENKKGDDFIKITYIPDFNVLCKEETEKKLDHGTISMIEKRCYDLAATCGSKVNVYFNDKKIKIKNFETYVGMHQPKSNPNKYLVEKINDRWTIGVQFFDLPGQHGKNNHISYVNHIPTSRGGEHCKYILKQLVTLVSAKFQELNKETVSSQMLSNLLGNRLRLFINCLIENPNFDSQTKHYLLTKPEKFGSECLLPDSFIKKVLTKTGVQTYIEDYMARKQRELLYNKLKQTDGSKTERLPPIRNFYDANLAGKKNVTGLTLIITEGLSASRLVLSSNIDRDRYGLFGGKGKFINVRGDDFDAADDDTENDNKKKRKKKPRKRNNAKGQSRLEQVLNNKEIVALKQILGLKHGKVYETEEDLKELRYSHIMLMTDQDHDGSHIKGLILNIFAYFWPSLLRVKGFFSTFITPIVKGTPKSSSSNSVNDVLEFYNTLDFDKWKQECDPSIMKRYDFKYYKGLGTSTAVEGQTYFKNIDKHRIYFEYTGKQDDEAFDMVFGNDSNKRKEWLSQYIYQQHGTIVVEPPTLISIDTSVTKLISYYNFLCHECILFAIQLNLRSIPSLIDSLKPSLRKITYCGLKDNLVNSESKVSEFGGYVSKHSSYHHGEASLYKAITGMAQNFVGKNNINLFYPSGQFGTRQCGGKQAASERYIFTRLSDITRSIFVPEDDDILQHLEDEFQLIEPKHYLPVVPLILMNGTDGMGFGWSTFIPNFNPIDVVNNLKLLIADPTLDSTSLPPLRPWYNGFRGTIKPDDTKNPNTSFIVEGIITVQDEETLIITELPVGVWTDDYKKDKLDVLLENKIIDKVFENHKETDICFTIKVTKEQMKNLLPPNDTIEIESKMQTLVVEEKAIAALEKTTTTTTEVTPIPKKRKRKETPTSSSDSKKNKKKNKQQQSSKKVKVKKVNASNNDLLSIFGLRTTLSLSNMHLFNENNKIEKFATGNDILVRFFQIRLPFIELRKQYYLSKLIDNCNKIKGRILFLQMIILGEIDIKQLYASKQNMADIIANLNKIPMHQGSYDYVTSMPFSTLSEAKLLSLHSDLEKEELEHKAYGAIHVQDMWEKNLDDFLVKLKEHYQLWEAQHLEHAESEGKKGLSKKASKRQKKAPAATQARRNKKK